MNIQQITTTPDQVPLREGVGAILEHAQFSVTPITAEQNRSLAVPIDFFAVSNGQQFVVKCLPNTNSFETADLQALVEICKSHGINELMLVGDGLFSESVTTAAKTLPVRLTEQAAYQQALANLPPDMLQSLSLSDEPAFSGPYVAKSAFDDPIPPSPTEGATPPPLPDPQDDNDRGSDAVAAAVMDRIKSNQPPVSKNSGINSGQKSALKIVATVIACLVLLGIIGVSGIAIFAGLYKNKITAALEEQLEQAQPTVPIKKLMKSTMIETRKSSGFDTTDFDDNPISDKFGRVLKRLPNGNKLPTQTELVNLFQQTNPSFRIGASALFVADTPQDLASKVKAWPPLIKQADTEFGSMTKTIHNGKVWAWIYHGNSISQKEQLDNALEFGGRAILKCNHCEKDSMTHLTAHPTHFVAPVCPNCKLITHVFGPNTEGNLSKACDFLTGFEIPQSNVDEFLPDNPAARTPENDILAHWSALLERCDYKYDSSARDIWKRSDQTWNDKVGDCEDTTILLADALISAGYQARVVFGTWKGDGHAWCVVKEGNKQWILESTVFISEAVSLRNIITEGSDYIGVCMFDRDSIYLRRHAANLSTPDYFSEGYWLKMKVKDTNKPESAPPSEALSSNTPEQHSETAVTAAPEASETKD